MGPSPLENLLFENSLELFWNAPQRGIQEIQIPIATYTKLGLLRDAYLVSGSCVYFSPPGVHGDNQPLILRPAHINDCAPTSEWSFRLRSWNAITIAIATSPGPRDGSCLRVRNTHACLDGLLKREVRRETTTLNGATYLEGALPSHTIPVAALLTFFVAVILLFVRDKNAQKKIAYALCAVATVGAVSGMFAATLTHAWSLRFLSAAALDHPRSYYRAPRQSIFFEGQRRDVSNRGDTWVASLPASISVLRLDLHAPGKTVFLQDLNLCAGDWCERHSGAGLLPKIHPVHKVTAIELAGDAIRIAQSDPTANFWIDIDLQSRRPPLFLACMVGAMIGVVLASFLAGILLALLALSRWMSAAPARVIVCFSVPISVVFSLVVPPLQNPDEDAHLLRVIQVLNGHLLSSANGAIGAAELDWPAPDPLQAFRALRFQSTVKTTSTEVIDTVTAPISAREKRILWTPAGNYSPIAYLCQLPGAFLGFLLGMSPLKIMYCARISALLLFALAAVLGLRLLPSGREFALVLLTLPMTLALSAAVSADTTTIAAAFLFFSALARLSTSSSSESKATWTLVISALALGGAKPLYAGLTLCAVPLLATTHRRHALAAILGAAGVACSWALLTFVSSLTAQVPTASSQIYFLTREPFAVLEILSATFWAKGVFFVQSFIGVFGWLDTYLHGSVYLAFFILLIAVGIRAGSEPRSTGMLAWAWVRLLAATVVVAAMLAMFVANSPEGGMVVEGFQGRYLIPALFFFTPIRPSDSGVRALVPMVAIAMAPWVLLGVTSRFYW